MLHEYEWWPASSFITLTYDDEHMPLRGSLLPLDLELWLKRVRRGIEPRRMRFYGAGEYGEKFNRPHYHVIAFGLDPASDREVVDESWQKGFVNVGHVSEHSIRYVADYVQSKLYGEVADRVYEGRTPPFARMSQGLGRDWCDARAEALRASMSLTHRGHTVALPRYYARRLGIREIDSLPARLEHAAEVVRVHSERGGAQLGEWYTWDSVQKSCEQSELDAIAKWNLFKRGSM